MNIEPLELEGVYLISSSPMEDERGSFSRTFCEATLRAAGLHHQFPQHNISCNTRHGTVRGMHFQKAPHEEVKIVRCVAGALDDCVVDIRPNSPTRGKSLRIELRAEDNLSLYIPTGLAHGFQTLTDNTTLHYLMGSEYVAGSSAGFRWNDSAFDIKWTLPISAISDKDETWPSF